MAWASLASPTYQRSGPASTKCSAFLRAKPHIRIHLVQRRSLLREQSCSSRDEGAETVSLKFNRLFAETNARTHKLRHFRHFASQELIIVWFEVRVLPAPPRSL